MNFLLEKPLIKCSCTYWLLSLCKIFKKFLGPIQSYEDVPFSGLKWPICPEQFFFVQTIIITFIYLLALFIAQNLKKFLRRIQSYEDVPFLGPKWSICSKQIFFLKIIKITLIYLLAPFIVQNFKKVLPADPVFGNKMAHFPRSELFSEDLLMSLVSFIHAYLHAKNQSQILIY